MADKNELGVNWDWTKDQVILDSESKKKSKKIAKVKKQNIASTATAVDENLQYANAIEEPYINSFRETQNALKGTVIQTDDLLQRINEDISAVRQSKTLKNKYVYLTNLTSSASSLISAKLQGIREMNSTIKNCHELEIKRMHELHLNDKTEQNDDMKMMDMYNAFINAPVGMIPAGSTQRATISDMVAIPGTAIDNGGNSMFAPNELTPEQNRMRMESNPNIKEVVKFNQSTGERYFDVIDTSTGASVPNYPRSDPFLLQDTTISVHDKIARNRNIDQVWPLIVIGNSEY